MTFVYFCSKSQTESLRIYNKTKQKSPKYAEKSQIQKNLEFTIKSRQIETNFDEILQKLTFSDKNRIDFLTVPACETAEELRRIIDEFPDQTSLSPTEMKEILLKAQCDIKCQKKRFFLRTKKDEIYVDQSQHHPRAFITIESIEQDDLIVEKEVHLFNYWALFSSIGGLAGLLLGYSILTFVEIATGQLDKIILAISMQFKSSTSRE